MRGSWSHAVRVLALALGGLVTACGNSAEADPFADPSWRHEFGIKRCDLAPSSGNDYFVLDPGFRLVLEGGGKKLQITVLGRTRQVDRVLTRVVEEREWSGDELVEVSRNFFAACPATHDVFYFGEEVDTYSDGQISSHEGAWLAGRQGARLGLIMPGEPKAGMRYYQEIAPDVALDRAEVVSVDETIETRAGTFTQGLKTEEGTALDTGEHELKLYAPGIGLVQEEDLILTEYGRIGSP